VPGRHVIAGIIILLPLSLGLSQCEDDTIQHADLVAAAEAVGEHCEAPNPQHVTLCGDIAFVDGDPKLAKRLYEARCFPTDPTGGDLGAWVWYDEGDWEFEVASTAITPDAVRVISGKLGADARDCRRNLG
jgi:hypothetical protein